ncbi:ATP-binding protein [Anaerotalea alkaliphila]|uniref:Anti-sigma regulatory factor n=1 Tax=Anaerotalea alkaliphila TaxID=2662126 RepID=A0A7X5HWI8_9FIRM|nr:ATP-binding protein [Anaerotalea alkaliphila]NDL67962.1 anti-sigma regulatory factor [Anaerotalea alkaliphila]
MKMHYDVEGGEFINVGTASSQFKKTLKMLGIGADIIRRISISMYEAEINMVIHANGGSIDTEITPERIHVVLQDQGPGIENLDLAMKAGYSTASRQAREMGFGAGMGLQNMKRNCDELQISSVLGEGTRVEITVYLNQES